MSNRSHRGAPGAANIQQLQQQAGAHFQAGRFAKALAACEKLLKAQPGRPDVHAFAGMAALKLEAFDKAAAHYKQALARRPDFVEARYNLGRAHQLAGELDLAATAYRKAAEMQPDLVPAHHNLGSVLQALERYDEAARSYENALQYAPDSAETQRNLGLVLLKLDRPEEAESAFRAALRLRPDWTEAHNNLVDAKLALGDAAGAVEAAETWLEADPGSVAAMSYQCVALNELGDKKKLHYWLDFDGLVRKKRWDTIEGFESLDAFNAALVAHVENHPTLKVPPVTDPTYHHPNLHITEELLAGDKGPMATLEKMMYEAVEDYLATVSAAPDHPYLAHWPEKWRITAWGVIIEGEGNLAPHLHLEGYMGGCYYPHLPAVVADEKSKAGWFQLGHPPDEMPLRAEHETIEIQPQEGLMLLFPGYYYHATVPFKSDERRVSIAFDVIADH